MVSGLQNPIFILRYTQDVELGLPGYKLPHCVSFHCPEAFVGLEYFAILLSGAISRGDRAAAEQSKTGSWRPDIDDGAG
jgi:hypothetical protein